MSLLWPCKPQHTHTGSPKQASLPACRWLLVGLLFGMGILSGCDPGAQSPGVAEATRTPRPTATQTATPQPVTASPTPTASPTVTSQPTSTPTPSPTPSPTPLPHTRLEQARKWQTYGNLQEAQKIYAVLSAAPDDAVPESVRAEAAYRLGECYHLEGHHLEAAAALQKFLEEHADSTFQPAAHFRLADSLVHLGQLERATEHYQAYLQHDDALADLVYGRLGDAHAAQAQDEQALAWYRRAAEAAPDRVREFTLLEQVALAESRLGHTEAASEILESLLDRSQYAPYRARIAYQLGELWREAAQEDKALDYYRMAVDEDVSSQHAYLAMVRLVEAQAPVDEYQRGLTDYHNQVYWLAAAAFQRVLEDEAHPHRDEARLYLARSYRALGLSQMAADWYRLALDAAPKAPWAAQAWLEWAEALRRAGHPEAAQDTLQEFAQQHPAHAQTPLALWQKAQIVEQAEGCQEAIPEYQHLAQQVPESPYASRALVQAGLCLYGEGAFEDALSQFQDATSLAEGQSDAIWQATFWVGKAHLALGQEEQAHQAWQNLVEGTPDTYYALRAQEIMGTLPAFTGLASSQPGQSDEPATPEPITANPTTLAWIAGWAGEEDASSSVTAQTYESTPQFRRAMALLQVGLADAAADELDTLRQNLADQPQALYLLAVHLAQQGLQRPAARAAATLVGRAPTQSFAGVPADLRRFLYPMAYRDLILRQCRTYGLSPYLLAAVIRQESLFDVQAVSTAQARGLMQIIGDTGRWIAMKLGWSNFQEEMLHRPYVNLEFGAYYLKVQLDTFDGDLPRALAAYNAGPGRASQWGEGIADPDLFVERIGLQEPRRYVERVYEGYHQYRQLYVESLVAIKR